MPSAPSTSDVEHFVTLFDNNFLPMGLCLHQSLLAQGGPFRLWVICMDEQVESNLKRLALPHVETIPVREMEDERLLAVKPGRSRGEYCWTLTPFVSQAVFDRDKSVERVTYLDADLFFFGSPQPLFEELEQSGKDVMITDHAYDPRYAGKARRSGRFCVQFITFRRTAGATEVMQWWQDRCIEWCYARVENGKYGDQKYLDHWPVLFDRQVHVLQQKSKTLAPWNVRYYRSFGDAASVPAFYHFHGLRIESPTRVLLYSGYDVGNRASLFYETYVKSLEEGIQSMRGAGISVPLMPPASGWMYRILRWKRRVVNGEGIATLPGVGRQ